MSSPHVACMLDFSQAAHTSSLPEIWAISSDFDVIMIFGRLRLRRKEGVTRISRNQVTAGFCVQPGSKVCVL